MFMFTGTLDYAILPRLLSLGVPASVFLMGVAYCLNYTRKRPTLIGGSVASCWRVSSGRLWDVRGLKSTAVLRLSKSGTIIESQDCAFRLWGLRTACLTLGMFGDAPPRRGRTCARVDALAVG